MPGVGDQRRGVDSLAYRELVPGHYLVTDDAEHGPGDPRSDVGGAAVLEQLANALESGERGAGPDDHGNTDPGQVLGPLQPVRILLRGRPAGQPEAQEHHRAGGHVRQIVDRISQQPDRAGQHRDQQLGQPGQAQPDRADRHCAIGLPPLIRVIPRISQRNSQGRVALSSRLVHPARITIVTRTSRTPADSLAHRMSCWATR
jgi:hypothetical protein